MAIASMAVRTSNVTTNQANVEIIGSTNTGYRLLEIGLTINAATASVYGMGVPAATGITPTTPVALVYEDGGNTATALTQTALAWGTSPTNPTAYSRRVSLPATIGAGIIWTFPRGFPVLKGKTLTVSNIGATSVADVWCVVDE